MRKISAFLLTSALVAVTSSPVLAQDWHGHGGWGGPHGYYNYDHWRGGSWYNGFHDGRNGWWWTVDGGWYYYPAPIYPYPDPYTPPAYVTEGAPAPAPGAAPTTLYYCDNPAGYYPSVPSCPTSWQRIPASDANMPPQAAPAPAPQPTGASSHDIDRQQLGVFSARLQNVDPNDPHARTKLKDLGKQVEAFRQSLYTRDYNAMDVLKDAEGLKKQIDDERKSLAASHASAAPTASPAPVASPPANSLPPGTTVTFPPQ